MSRVINLCREISGSPSKNASIVESLIRLFKKYGSTPALSSASLIPLGSGDSYKLGVNWSHIDFDALEKISFQSDYTIQSNGSVVDLKNIHDTSNVSHSVYSHDGKLKAVVRDIAKDGKSNQVIEIWANKNKVKTISGDKDKAFGKVHLSSTIGSLSWSIDGSQFMFIAEKYVTTTGFFNDKKKDDKNGDIKDSGDSDIKPTELGNEYIFKEDWGEQLVGSCHPIVCIIDLADDCKLRTIDVPDVTATESFWIDSKTIGFVGIKEEPRRLGLIFCPIRGSCLYMCDLRDPESEPVPIFGRDFELAVRSPRVSHDSKKIVFLANPPNGPHFQSSSLMLLTLPDLKVKTLIGVNDSTLVDFDAPTEIRSFYSLYLPVKCWTMDNKKILINPESGYRDFLFTVDVENNQFNRIDVPGGETVSLLDFRDNFVVLNIKKPNLGSNLHVGKLVDNQITQLTRVEADLCVSRDDLGYRYDVIERNDASNGRQLISCIVVGPKESFGKPTPTILVPHGGPHTSYTLSYIPRYALMAEAGFKVILVNYRGSSGINSAHEKFLCGKVGTTDVADCMEVLNYYINRGEVDKDQVCLYGGSHGGFLVTHLVGQYPEFGFKACVALNPVTDLASGFSTSDIPEWQVVEGLGLSVPFTQTTLPTPEMLSSLLQVSPIVHVDKVKTPVLIVLGTQDKRVAMCQGRNYFHALKARGVPTKCLIYDDDHSINKTKYYLDVEMNSLLWMLDHLVLASSS